jgi:hypothetical protein
VGRNADGRLEVLVVGTGFALKHIKQLTPGGAWSEWKSLGGNPFGNPTVVRNQRGRLEAFVTSASGFALHQIEQLKPGGQWSEWESLGGSLTSAAPAVVSGHHGRLQVFVRGSSLRLWYRQHAAPGGPWSCTTGSD